MSSSVIGDGSVDRDPAVDGLGSPDRRAGHTPDAWWDDVRAAALVGTGRRPAPADDPFPVAARRGADAQTRLLDHIALGAAWRAAGVTAQRAETPAPSPPDETPAAPARAAQLLDLALTQPGRRRDELARHWARECVEAGRRAPVAVLPRLLDIAAADEAGADDLMRCVGARGRWLAALSPRWAPLPTRSSADPGSLAELPDGWLRRPAAEQAALLSALHGADPGRARDAVREVSAGASARDRATYLRALEAHLGPDDEDLLDAALDDRAAGVREVATDLLARLPGSARAARMAARLRPLIAGTMSMTGRRIHVELPDDPDDAGVRDGLRAPPPGRSTREHHLRLVVGAAPLATWTEATGLPADKVVARLKDENGLLTALCDAAAAQRDTAWADALLDDTRVGLHPGLLAAIGSERLEAYARERLRRLPAADRVTLLQRVPGPWSPGLSDLAVAVLRAGDIPATLRLAAIEALYGPFHPAAALGLQAWAERLPHDDPLRRPLATLLAHVTLRQSISEAFR